MEPMQFDQLIKHLEHSLKQPLPGVKAHTRLFPPTRSEFPPINFSAVKIGAVLAMLFSQNGQTRLTFILRQKYNGVHSGQISFQGGGYEENDLTYSKTATRETQEEIGVPEEEIKIIGQLSQLYIPPSNFLVYPFVGYIQKQPNYKPDITEVTEVFDLSLNELMKEECFQFQPVISRSKQVKVPCFVTQNRLIWGATAMILNELLEIIKQGSDF